MAMFNSFLYVYTRGYNKWNLWLGYVEGLLNSASRKNAPDFDIVSMGKQLELCWWIPLLIYPIYDCIVSSHCHCYISHDAFALSIYISNYIHYVHLFAPVIPDVIPILYYVHSCCSSYHYECLQLGGPGGLSEHRAPLNPLVSNLKNTISGDIWGISWRCILWSPRNSCDFHDEIPMISLRCPWKKKKNMFCACEASHWGHLKAWKSDFPCKSTGLIIIFPC